MLIDWLGHHWVELVGTLFAFLYLYLSVRENIWLWVTGFVSSFFFLIVFFNERFYADMGLQGYYLVISIYGWLVWKYGRERTGRPKMPVSRVTGSLAVKLGIAFVISYIIIAVALLELPVLIGIPASDLPYWDAFTTAGSFVATWMLARKKIEHWLVWVVVDLVSCGMYVYKEMDVTVVLYFIYTVVAVVGYREWLKQLKTRDKDVSKAG